MKQLSKGEFLQHDPTNNATLLDGLKSAITQLIQRWVGCQLTVPMLAMNIGDWNYEASL